MLKINNSHFEIAVNEIGAELSSIQCKSSGKEFIWNGNPNIWGSTAPVLFPIIGGLKNEEIEINGVKYKIPKHGIVRNSSKLQFQTTETSIVCKLESDEEIKTIYPYDFKFEIEYILIDNVIEVNHRISNLSEKEEMYFSVGGHPAFAFPWNNDEKYEDYFIEFEQEETSDRWLVTKEGLIASQSEKFLNCEKTIQLNHELFSNDALIFKSLKSNFVRLKNQKGEFIEVSLTDFENLGIWAKTNGDFVCIEPWNGIADSENTSGKIEEKEGIIKLLPKEVKSYAYRINISI